LHSVNIKEWFLILICLFVESNYDTAIVKRVEGQSTEVRDTTAHLWHRYSVLVN
jgi:hypothetical protein